MKRLFDISLEEKNRILEMHQSATKKNYLFEQGLETGDDETDDFDSVNIPVKKEPKFDVPKKIEDSEVEEFSKAISHLRDRMKELRKARREESIEVLFNNTKRVILTALNKIIEKLDYMKLTIKYTKEKIQVDRFYKQYQKLEEAKRKLEESKQPATLEDLEKMRKDIFREIGSALVVIVGQIVFFSSQRGKRMLQNVGMDFKDDL
jgi:molybdopterin converting factor small subunit